MWKQNDYSDEHQLINDKTDLKNKKPTKMKGYRSRSRHTLTNTL